MCSTHSHYCILSHKIYLVLCFQIVTSNPKGGIKEKMNTFRKIKKKQKALSPVVASIILIAVTVAVSIAVAAWMGGMTIGFMGTAENLNVRKPMGMVIGQHMSILNVTNSGGNVSYNNYRQDKQHMAA